jgi:hypothetical protein
MFVITDLARLSRLAGAGGHREEDRVALWQLFSGGLGACRTLARPG